MRVDHFDPFSAQSGGRVVGLDRRDGVVHPRHHAPDVDRGFDGLEADLVGRAHRVGRAGRGDQRLAGHTPRPQAVAAGPVLLGQQYPRAHTGGADGRGEPCGATADDDEVVAGHGASVRSLCSGRAHTCSAGTTSLMGSSRTGGSVTVTWATTGSPSTSTTRRWCPPW